MKKKLFTVALALIIAITAISGASLAYLKDSDGAKNVMVTGNVHIIQNELDRNGNAFQNGQKLLPAVYDSLTKVNGLWTDCINNEIDKIVTVTNTGSEPAYIRTIIAFETTAIYEANTSNVIGMMHDMYLGVNGSYTELKNSDGSFVTITVNGVQYALAVYTYKGAAGNGKIAPGETTESSLRQFFLSPDAGNEFFDELAKGDGMYDILCLSQAVQVEGFENADQALNRAFGEVNATNATEWFASVQ